MRRCAGLGLLVAVVASITGCGLALFSTVAPDARLSPPPGTYQEAVYVEPDRSDGQSFYWSETPGATMDEFESFDGVPLAGDRTFWYFTISTSGARSRIVEAVYTIEDGSAPSVSEPIVWQTPASYWSYGIVWNATAPNTSATPDPTDDVTPSDLLEYAVFSSASDNIGTVEEAVANGRVELTWRNWWELEWLSSDAGSGVFVDPDGGRLGIRYTAGRPGERRFFNVLVRDGEGNATAYGTQQFASRSAQSIYVAEPTAPDVVQLNNAIDVDVPGGEPSFTDSASSPRADGGATFQFATTVGVALGRIDDDSFDDLAIVVGDGTLNSFRWYPGLGNGRFDGDVPAVELMTDADNGLPRTVAIADFTGDGTPEIIVSTHDGSIYWLRVYDRDGGPIVSVPAKARDVAVGDVTGDGYLDIVAWDTATGDIEVWINNGGTSLSLVTQSWTPPTGFVNAELADINNDGKDDLLVATTAPPAVEIYHGTATGALSGPLAVSWFRSDLVTTINDATHVTPIDFNRDGRLDLFIGTSDLGFGSSLQINNGDGTFTGIFETGNADATDSVVFDANGDGWPDIIEVFNTAAPELWLNQEGFGLNAYSFTIGSTNTSMIAAGRLR